MTTPTHIIDCHVHLESVDGRYHEPSVQRCLTLADRAGIDRLVYLFDLANAVVDPNEIDIMASNDLGLELMERHGDRFDAFCYLNPRLSDAFTRSEIDRCIVNGPCTGIKLWISVKADDFRLDPIMERAAELNVPVLHHAWYKANGFVFNESNPSEIAHLAKRHPTVPIVMAHLAGGGWRGVRDIRDCPNVVVDTSGAQPHAGLVRYAIELLGPERVVYGSDWPIRDFAVQRARVSGADLSPEVEAKVMGQTMARLLSGNRGEA